MTPHHLHALAGWNLHALAAAWSLHTARQHLAQYARDEAAQIAAERLNAADGLRSPTWGTRHASGGHGDPVSTLLLTADRPARRNRWAEMAERAERRITGIAAMIRIDGVRDPLVCILAALPNTLPGTAAVIARHLADEDAWIRNALQLDREWEPVPGSPACPACRVRCVLRVQTAGPQDAWTVVCAGHWEDGHHNPCLCVGAGCSCGMPGAVEGVAHIWPRAAVISGAVAGAAPTATTEGATR